MVIIHGYGGSGPLFFKIMKPLMEKYHCIYIDIIGMGGSSRPAWSAASAEEADGYFVEFIEKWRSAFGITGFVLAGHSYGGFICGHYAVKYH